MAASQLAPSGEELRPEQRLRQRRDFVRCYRRGRRIHGSWAILHVHANEGDGPRLGITASRKVGNAVVRNRMKRRTREVFRRWSGRRDLPAVDVVVHLRPGRVAPRFDEWREDLESMLRSIGGRRP